MDESGSQPDSEQAESRRCSVRGCQQPLAEGTQNKMCDTCRGRHRIYASTKRAKRKLEKAAVVGAGAVNETVLLTGGSAAGVPQQAVQAWYTAPTRNARFVSVARGSPQLTASPSIASASTSGTTSTSASSWSDSVDPRVFSGDEQLPQHHVPTNGQQTSSSLELANALTLPTRTEAHPSSQTFAQPANRPSSSQTPSEQKIEDVSESLVTEDGPIRCCSVKGCKLLISAPYNFKMCPSCRTRYRSYATAKRAKWKTERETFDHETVGLRTVEDKRRTKEGLSPLADSPDELRAWELSIDEKVLDSKPSQSQLDPLAMTAPGGTTQAMLTEEGMAVSSMVLAGVYPASIAPSTSIDTPYSHSPYPQFKGVHTPPNSTSNDLQPPLSSGTTSCPTSMTPAPLSARMCTVSHCHHILPGSYQYKICGQHRLQNRWHGRLKRERVKKAMGGNKRGKGDELNESPHESGEEEVNDDDDGGEEELSVEGVKEKETHVLKEDRTRKEQESEENAMDEGADGDKNQNSKESCKQKTLKPSKFICASDECHNLLSPSVRWKACEECRTAEQRRKTLSQLDALAAKWKSTNMVPASTAPIMAMAMLGGSVPMERGQHDEHHEEASAGSMDADGEEDEDDDVDSQGEEDEVSDTLQPSGPPVAQGSSSSSQPPQAPCTTPYVSYITSGHSRFRINIPPGSSLPPSAPSGSRIHPFRAPPVSSSVPVPAPSTGAAQVQLDRSQAYQVFTSTTATSSVGRLLVRNAAIGADVLRGVLATQGASESQGKVQETKPAVPPTAKAIPTLTVPVSEPFVYKAPPSNLPQPQPQLQNEIAAPVGGLLQVKSTSAAALLAAATTSESGKRKRKPAEQGTSASASTQASKPTSTTTKSAAPMPASSSSSASASAPPRSASTTAIYPIPLMSTVSAPPHLDSIPMGLPPSAASYGPYGYPPQYTYYSPYYMPPYPMGSYQHMPPQVLPPPPPPRSIPKTAPRAIESSRKSRRAKTATPISATNSSASSSSSTSEAAASSSIIQLVQPPPHSTGIPLPPLGYPPMSYGYASPPSHMSGMIMHTISSPQEQSGHPHSAYQPPGYPPGYLPSGYAPPGYLNHPSYLPHPHQHLQLLPPQPQPPLPRFSIPNYSHTSGQQPYSGMPLTITSPMHPVPSGSGGPGGYPYYVPYIPTGGPSGSMAAKTRPTVKGTAKEKGKERERGHENERPMSSGQVQARQPQEAIFSYYHYGTGDSQSATTPEKRGKRRKVDPSYLERYQAQIMGVPSMSMAMAMDEDEDGIEEEDVAMDVAHGHIAEASSEDESETHEGLPGTEKQQRQCVNKTCSRTIADDVVGGLCDRCKLKFKKHQKKARMKFKLVPKKPIAGTRGARKERSDS